VPRIDLIQLRKQTAANWTLANPILELIEPGVETDTDLMKFGNGTSNWNDLPYATHKHTNASVLAKDNRVRWITFMGWWSMAGIKYSNTNRLECNNRTRSSS
jgi:hypothetical protein